MKEQTKILKREKNKKKFTGILLAIIIIYVLYAVYLTIKTPNDTVKVENGILTEEESTAGYIVRDEIVVKGENYKNGIYQIISEADRAAKGETIYRYYGKNEEDLQGKIEEINEKIQDAIEKEGNIFPTDIKNLENQIDDKIQDLKNISDINKINEYKKQIAEILLKKAKIAGENSKSGTYIKKLIDQREEYEEDLVAGSEYVSAPKSGVVSYRVDGFEELLNIENMEKLTQTELERLDIKTGKIISKNDECAKIVNNFEGYIVTFLNSVSAKEAEVGRNVLITLSNGVELKATINSIKEQEDGKKLIIFKVKTLTEELISYRKISINITWWSTSGLKVPNNSPVK